LNNSEPGTDARKRAILASINPSPEGSGARGRLVQPTCVAVPAATEVAETDKELRVWAELPGLEEKEVEVLMDEGALTIRGEKKSEVEDKDRQFSERYYGRFKRRIPLGFESRRIR